jgi:hypothetical protein
MTIEGRQQWLAQQRQKREGIICQDAALLNKYSGGTALTDEEKKRVQRLQKNAQQRKHRCKDTALLNKYFDEEVDLPVTEERRKGCDDWILHEIKSNGSVTIATRELHGMMNTIAGESCFYTRDGRILLHLF